MSSKSNTISGALAALHERVDELAGRIATLHGDRLTCHRGCAGCCVDGLAVFAVEADRIQSHHGDLLANAAPAPQGGCAFLDEKGACRIYEVRPYVCRTQGLPLRWLDEEETDSGDLELVEYRDICELNAAGPLLAELPEGACWPIGPVERELQRLQAEATPDDPMRRVTLRDLFGR